MSKPLRVMLVEDETISRHWIESAVGTSRIEVELSHTETLTAAKQREQDTPHDLVILDLGLPDSTLTDTIAFADSIKGVVVAYTMHDDESIVRRLGKAGVVRMISKQFVSAEELERLLWWADEFCKREAV